MQEYSSGKYNGLPALYGRESIFLIFLVVMHVCYSNVETTKPKQLPDYAIPVFYTEACPVNFVDWNNASERLNCTNKSTGYDWYHCLPNANLTLLLEFCYDQKWIIMEKGNCLVLDARETLLDNVKCNHFTDGCPAEDYQSYFIYKHPRCTEIYRGCYVADPGCQPRSRESTEKPSINTLSEKTTKKPFITIPTTNAYTNMTTEPDNGIPTEGIIGIVFAVIIVIVALAVVLYCYWKRRICKGKSIENLNELEERKPLNETNFADEVNNSVSGSGSGGTMDDTADREDESAEGHRQGHNDGKVQVNVESNGGDNVFYTSRQNDDSDVQDGGRRSPPHSEMMENISADGFNESTFENSMDVQVHDTSFTSDEENFGGVHDEVYMPNISLWEEEDVVFCENTHLYREVKEFFLRHNISVLTGGPGSGKTATARHIAVYMSKQGWRLYDVPTIGHVTKLRNDEMKQIFLCDDPIGLHGLDIKRLSQISLYHWSLIEMYAKKTNFKLLLTCRRIVMNEAITLQPLIEKNIIDLSDDYGDIKLNEKEREAILRKHCETRNVQIPTIELTNEKDKESSLQKHCILNEVINRVKESSSSKSAARLMFPLLCRLYTTNTDYQILGNKFFSNPKQYLWEQFEKMKENDYLMYTALSLCMLNENKLTLSKLKFSCEEMFAEIFKGFGKTGNDHAEEVYEKLKCARGTYVHKSQNDSDEFSLLHDSYVETIAIHFGNSHPKLIIKYLRSNFLVKHVTLETSSSNSNNKESVVLQPTHDILEALAERLYKDIKAKNLHDAFMNTCWHNPSFQQLFFELMKKLEFSELKNDFVFSKHYRATYISGKSQTESDKSTKGQTESDLSEWNCQELLIDREWENDSDYIHTKKAISWIIRYACTPLLEYLIKEILQRGGTVSDIFGSTIIEQTRFLILSCYSEDKHTVDIVFKHIDKKCLNSTCISEKGNRKLNSHRAITPIEAACQRKQLEIITYLLDAGANTEISGNGEANKSLLYTTLRRGDCEIAICLLDRGANITVRDQTNRTILHIASLRGNVKFFETFLSRFSSQFADLDIEDNTGKVPLYYALETAVQKFEQKKNIENNLENYKKQGREYFDIANQLIQDYEHQENTYLEIAELLICQGASLKIWTNIELIEKTENKQKEVVEKEEEEGNEKTEDGEKQTEGKEKHIKIGNSPIYRLFDAKKFDIIKTLLEKGLDVNMCDRNGAPVLHYGALCNNCDILECILSQGANIDQTDHSNRTALHRAIEKDFIEIVRHLLENKACVNICDSKGLTPLCHAANKGATAYVKLLVEKGAEVNAYDKRKGRTPLHFACLNGKHTEIVMYLLSQGADVDMTDKGRKIPVQLAEDNGHFEIVDCIRNFSKKSRKPS